MIFKKLMSRFFSLKNIGLKKQKFYSKFLSILLNLKYKCISLVLDGRDGKVLLEKDR